MAFYRGGVRSSRLLAVLLHLQATGGATAAALAEVLEVSVRTIYRDVSALQAAGVPVWTETGPGGGIRLVDGWRTRLDGLTADEAGALFLAGAPAAVADLGLGTVLAGAQAKVMAALPPELRARAARVRERFLLDAPGWFGAEEELPHLATLAEAVWAGRRVEVRYRRASEDVERLLDPLGLVLKAGTWYLVAGAGGSVRTYRVSRVTAAEVRDERVERPPGFDLDAHWSAAAEDFDRSMLRARVTLRLSPRAQRLLPHLTTASAAARALAARRPSAEGWCVVDLDVESEEVAAEQLAGLGGGVEVLAPASLRATLAATGRAMAEANGGTPRPR